MAGAVCILLASVLLVVWQFSNVGLNLDSVLELEKEWNLVKAEELITPLPDLTDLDVVITTARILLKRGEVAKAADFLSALSDFNISDNPELLWYLSKAYYFTGKQEKSLSAINRLKSLAENTKDSLALSRALNLSGRIAFNNADYDMALDYQTESLKIAKASSDIQAEADALRQLGVLYWYKSEYEAALQNYFEPALRLYQNIDDKKGEATTLSNIGLVYSDINKKLKAIRYLLESFNIRRKIGDQTGLADSYYFLSNNLTISGWNHTYHYSLRRKSYEISKEIGYRWGAEVAARSLLMAVNSDLSLNNYFISQVDSLLFQNGEGLIYRKEFEARLALNEGHYKTAARLSEAVIDEHSKAENIRGVIHGYYLAGQADLKLKKYLKAESHFKHALSLIENEENYSLMSMILHYSLTRVMEQTNRREEAIRKLKELADQIDISLKIRVKKNPETFFFDRTITLLQKIRKDAYQALVENLFYVQDESLFEYIEREKHAGTDITRDAMTFFFKNPSWNEFISVFREFEVNPQKYDQIDDLIEQISLLFDENIDLITDQQRDFEMSDMSEPVSLRELQAVLSGEEAFIQYYAGENDVFAQIIRRDTTHILTLPIPPDELYSVTDVLSEAIQIGRNDAANLMWKAPAAYLYTFLVDPLKEAGAIERGENLYISANGILNRVPFQLLLQDQKTGSEVFLVEMYDVSYLPAAFMLVDSRKSDNRKLRSMLSAAPDTRHLPFTKQEVESIPYHHFTEYRKLSDSRASSGSVVSAMKKLDLFHFAGHIEVNPWFPLSSRMQFADRSVRLYEFLEHWLNLNLVILSACESGPVRIPAHLETRQRDLNSFSRVFLLAGAKNVIASHWLVEDKATAQLMQDFYDQLQKSGFFNQEFYGKQLSAERVSFFSIALSSAQRNYIRQARKNGKTVHPFYWAAFTLTGAD